MVAPQGLHRERAGTETHGLGRALAAGTVTVGSPAWDGAAIALKLVIASIAVTTTLRPLKVVRMVAAYGVE